MSIKTHIHSQDCCEQVDKSENHILKNNILISRRKAIMLYLRLNAVAKQAKTKEP